MFIITCEIDHQPRLDAWDRALRADALGWPWGMGWGGSGCGTHIHLWLIHVDVWQKPPQYCKVISLQLKKKTSKETCTVSQIFAQLTFSVKLVSIWVAFSLQVPFWPFFYYSKHFNSHQKAFIKHLVNHCIASEITVAKWISAKGLYALLLKKA